MTNLSNVVPIGTSKTKVDGSTANKYTIRGEARTTGSSGGGGMRSNIDKRLDYLEIEAKHFKWIIGGIGAALLAIFITLLSISKDTGKLEANYENIAESVDSINKNIEKINSDVMVLKYSADSIKNDVGAIKMAVTDTKKQ